jgi:hypothetical protein
MDERMEWAKKATSVLRKWSVHALLRHNNENSKQIFPEKGLRGYSPNSYTHVSVSDLYISLIGLPILLQGRRGGGERQVEKQYYLQRYFHCKASRLPPVHSHH